MSQAPVTYRIGLLSGSILVGIAVIGDMVTFFCDMTGFLIPLGMVLSFFIEGLIAVWFFIRGVSYFTGKRSMSKLLTVSAVFIINFVPIINALPELTIGTILIIRATRAEDREKAKELQAKIAAEDATKIEYYESRMIAQEEAARELEQS